VRGSEPRLQAPPPAPAVLDRENDWSDV